MPTPENEALANAPALPIETASLGRLVRRFAGLAVAATMLATAGLLGGAWLIAKDRPTAGIVVSAGSTFLGASGLFLVFGTTITPVTRRGHHFWLDPVSAASFQDSLARTCETLGAAPEPGDVAAAQQAMWKEAFEWHYDLQSATGNKSSPHDTERHPG
ncbi:hypothetical protein [Micromonospora cremea]|nr:hypothetical protein [Micromonospora cremea]